MKKRLLIQCLIGAPIGVTVNLIITVIFSLCTGHGRFYPAPQELIDLCGSEITSVIVQLICSLFIGAVIGGSFVIWGIERWSLSKQTLLHFAVMAVTFFPISYLLGWLPHNVYGALSFTGAFILMYVAVWLSIYLSIRAKIKKMNKQLQEMQQKGE